MKDFLLHLAKIAWCLPKLWAEDAVRNHGLLKVQRDLSLVGSNFANVEVLMPAAVKTRGSFEFGVSFGMIR